MEASSESGGDAHLVGRDKNVYRALYRIAKIALFEDREKALVRLSGPLFAGI